MRVVVFALFSIAIPRVSLADDASKNWPPAMPDDLPALRVRELKGFLDERGKTCVGCADKSDWIARVRETWKDPPKKEEQPKERGGEEEGGFEVKKEELLKKLGSKGIQFVGGDSMDLGKLEELVKAMDGIKQPKREKEEEEEERDEL